MQSLSWQLPRLTWQGKHPIGAAAYIENLDVSGVLWKCSQWVDVEQYVPPRFEIIASNTSESVNSMFNAARDLAWMDAIENIVDIMSTRICTLRTNYSKYDNSEVVPCVARILKAHWDVVAGMQVMELQLEGGDFKVTSAEYGCEDGDGEGVDPGV